MSETLNRLDAVIQGERKSNYQSFTVGFGSCGNPDELTLWHDFRWSFAKPVFDAQRCRIFRMGDTIEDIIIKDFRKANYRVHSHTQDGKQYTYKMLGGHLKGKLDLIVMDMPEFGKGAYPGDIKSANQSEFNRFKKVGLRQWNEKYWVQVQAAMAATGTKKGFLICECKNTSRRHIEFLDFDEMFWFGCLAKVRRVITRQDAPPSMYKTTDKEIKHFMDEDKRRIYLNKAMPDPHCRNCKYAEPIIDDSVDARWVCHKHMHTLTVDQQIKGCHDHFFLPCLVPNGFIQTIDSKALSAISKTKDLNQTLIDNVNSKEMQDLISINRGLEAIEVQCKDCLHFKANEVGGGQGVGTCLVNADEITGQPARPKGVRDCKKYSKFQLSFEVKKCLSKSIIPASVAENIDKCHAQK